MKHAAWVAIGHRPDYLTEPLIKSQDFTLNISLEGIGTGGLTTGWLYPCEDVE